MGVSIVPNETQACREPSDGESQINNDNAVEDRHQYGQPQDTHAAHIGSHDNTWHGGFAGTAKNTGQSVIDSKNDVESDLRNAILC